MLDYFQVPAPQLYTDVSPQIRDVDIRTVAGVDGEMSLRRAWMTMRDQQIDTLCVVDGDDRLKGVITVKDVATANMDGLDPHILEKAETSYQNIVEILEGTVLVGDIRDKQVSGRIIIGSGSAEQIEKSISPGDIVIVANRSESQLAAIEMGGGLCGGVRRQQGVPHHPHAGRGAGVYHDRHPQEHLCGRPDDQPGGPHPPLHDPDGPAHLPPEQPGGRGH